MAAIAAIPLAVGVAQREGTTSLWANGWFRLGFGMAAVGMLAISWSLVLFLAHRHAQVHASQQPAAHERRNWVAPAELGQYLDSINRTMEERGFGTVEPTPEAPSQESPPKNKPPPMDRQEELRVRTALRAVGNELDNAIATYGEAMRTGQLWKAWVGPRDAAWRKYRRVLRKTIPIPHLELLEDAYSQVQRLNTRRGGASLSWLVGHHDKAMVLNESDRLDEAVLASIH